MPALPNVANVLRVQFKHSSALDVDILNRVYFAYTGTAPTSANLNTMASTVFTNWGTALVGLAGSTTKLIEILIEDLTTPTSGVGLHTGSTTGTRSGGALPAATAALINFQVARRYRGGKPRVYVPYGVDSDLNGTQNWTTGFQSALLTGWNSWIADIIAAAPSGTTISNQVNVSYYKGFTSVQNPVTLRWRNIPTLRTTPVQDAIAATSVNLILASQRRRNRSGTS